MFNSPSDNIISTHPNAQVRRGPVTADNPDDLDVFADDEDDDFDPDEVAAAEDAEAPDELTLDLDALPLPARHLLDKARNKLTSVTPGKCDNDEETVKAYWGYAQEYLYAALLELIEARQLIEANR